jgi:transcriptional regulator with XRE-family HTH domain
MKINPIHYTSDITVFQLRAARYAVRITRNEILTNIGLSPTSLSQAEKGRLELPPKKTSQQTIFKLRSYYETKGIVFLENNTITYDPVGEGTPNYLFYLNENILKD